MTIARNLLADEQILYQTKKHLIIFLVPVLLLIASVFVGDYMYSNPVLTKLSWAPWFITAVVWAYTGVEYMTSHYAVTNKRVIMREGLFNRHVNEMRLTTISQVNVDQTLWGQLFGYGTVSINAFGAFDAFPMIAHPNEFQKYVNQQLDTLVK